MKTTRTLYSNLHCVVVVCGGGSCIICGSGGYI